MSELARVRRWIVGSSLVLVVLVVLGVFVVDPVLEALYAHGRFGPFDFSARNFTPKRPLAATQQRIAWVIAGLVANGVLSWGLVAAALAPSAIEVRLLPWASRSRAAITLGGLAVFGFAASTFSLTTPADAIAIPLSFGGLTLAGCALLRVHSLAGFGRVSLASGTLALVALTLPWLLADPERLDAVYAEDTAFEMLQAQLFAVAALVLWGARELAARGERALLLAGTLGFAFLAGEEISWGQRYLGFDTPSFWANTQNETTVHNHPLVDAWMNYRPVLVGWGAVSLTALALPALRRALTRWCLPIVPVLAWPTLVAALLVQHGPHDFGYRNTDEIQETFAALAFAAAAFALRESLRSRG